MKKFVEVTLTELDMDDITGNINVIISKLQRIAGSDQDAIDIKIVPHMMSPTKFTVKAMKYLEQG